LRDDIKRASEKQDRASERNEARCDKLYQTFAESSERYEARCDKLYQMFIDLLTAKKNGASND
jgi:glutathionylspermidine synthase